MPFGENPASHQNFCLQAIFIRFYKAFILVVAFLIFSENSLGQSPFPPPNQLQVFAAQELSFGSFYTGASGGEVIVSPEGNCMTNGSVMELALSPATPAVFDVRLIPGRIVHVSFPASAMLTRVGSSESMVISGFTSDKQGNYFVTTSAHPFINPVKVGATLHVGSEAANPSGDYVGSFSVTFIQE
ncbi:DUF4402 domain-containing protein [Maribellus comscasis]|uniref:DUF4402 domain-containing protein n=1 Tax=Maribellus comscasis TaxID=2681766 RepID=A0A6I6JXZ1_9BACT|nr:DUF4402 domain-containing protein [Maribellus comscasis]QGY46010.1 DUF4402 domain-containing protein [Maribellus comscasis]